MCQQDLRDGVPNCHSAPAKAVGTLSAFDRPCLALLSYPLYKSSRAAKISGDRNRLPRVTGLGKAAKKPPLWRILHNAGHARRLFQMPISGELSSLPDTVACECPAKRAIKGNSVSPAIPVLQENRSDEREFPASAWSPCAWPRGPYPAHGPPVRLRRWRGP